MTGGQGDRMEIVQENEIRLTIKWYMHNVESVPENEMHKLLWDFEIQTDQLIQARWPGRVIVNKKKKKKKRDALD